jgi:hypothetical protein
MNESQLKYFFRKLDSIDDSLKQIIELLKPQYNKDKPPGPRYLERDDG